MHIAEPVRKIRAGEPVYPAGKKRLYRAVEYNTREPPTSHIWTRFLDIRRYPHFNGWNHLMRMIEFDCNLAYGTISDPNNTDKTARGDKGQQTAVLFFYPEVARQLYSMRWKITVDAVCILVDIYHLSFWNLSDIL